MRRDVNAQVQVARLGAAAAVLTLAGDADARPLADARRYPHVDGAGVAIVFDRQTPHRAVVRVLEPELDFLLDVAALTRSTTAPAPRAPTGLLAAGAPEKCVKEV